MNLISTVYFTYLAMSEDAKFQYGEEAGLQINIMVNAKLSRVCDQIMTQYVNLRLLKTFKGL